MELTNIKSMLIEKCGAESVIAEETHGLQPGLVIHPDFIVSVCRELKENKETWFDFLSCLTGVDYGEQEGFGVVYHLASIPYKTQLTLKVKLARNQDVSILPQVESVSSVWKTADWHEREAFDLLGIFFNNHPDLRRILLPDDWEGYPLRKDFKDAAFYHGISIN